MAQFSDSASVLRELDLEPEVVQAQADFYVAYARRLESAQRPRRQGPGTVWTDLADSNPPWGGEAILASTYRMAAQYLALTAPQRAGEMAIRAAMAYLRARLPFGALLVVGLLDERMLVDAVASTRALDLIRNMISQRPTDDPVQRTYLLLTALAKPWLRQEYDNSIGILLQGLRPHTLQPIGALGRPLAGYLRLAEAMAQSERGASRIFDVVDDTVGASARSQAESLRAAQRNRYLWRHGASPLDIVNLEDVALNGLIMRSDFMLDDDYGYQRLAERFDGDDALAEIPLWVASVVSQSLLHSQDAIVEIMNDDLTSRDEEQG